MYKSILFAIFIASSIGLSVTTMMVKTSRAASAVTGKFKYIKLDERCFENGKFDRDIGWDDLDCGADLDEALGWVIK